MPGGDRWKATDDIYGWDVEFSQDRGTLIFNYGYGPCRIADLGARDLDGSRSPTREQVRMQGPREMEVRDGHLYLIDQGMWKRRILIKVMIKSRAVKGLP